MTILDKNTITLPNAQETYPNLVDSVNEGLFYYTIPVIIMSIGVIVLITGRILDRGGESNYKHMFFMVFFLISWVVTLVIVYSLVHKVEKDTTLMAEHVSQHPETEDNITVLANTIGFDYKDVCDTIMDNRESSLCGGEVFDSITWGDNDDVYRIEPDYDYNDTEDELIVTFNLKELTEEQSEL